MDPQWQYTPLVIPLGVSIGLICILILLGLHQWQQRIAKPFVIFMLCLLIWMVASVLEVITLNLRLSLFFADLSFLGITFFSVAWLSIVMIYTGRNQLLWRVLPYVMILPIVTNIVIWTNPLHNLWRGASYRDLTLTWFPVSFYEYGPWFYVGHIPFALLTVIVAIFLLVRSVTFRQGTYQRQSISLIIALILPVMVALLHELGVQPIPYYNASSLIFPISGVLVGWAVLNFSFLDLTPIARDQVVETMQDLMIVLDNNNRVRDINPIAKQRLFTDQIAIIGETIEALLPDGSAFIKMLHTTHPQQIYRDEIDLPYAGEVRSYEVLVSPIQPVSGQVTGQVFLLRDITERRKSEQAVYEQLQQVAILEERQRMARELHDSVNQTLFAAGTLANLLPMAVEKKPEKVPEYARDIKQLLQGATAEMRLILLELYPDAIAKMDLDVILRQMCQAFTGLTGITVNINLQAQIQLEKDVQFAFYRIAEEALNNINKHTDASTVSVQLQCKNHQVQLHIQDNGPGFDATQTPGGHFGLENMRNRAATVGATLDIISNATDGTTILLSKRLS